MTHPEPLGTKGAHPTPGDVMTRELLEITDDATLHAAIIARREWLRGEQKLLTAWAGVVQRRMRQTMTQQQVADAVKLSRAAVRKRSSQLTARVSRATPDAQAIAPQRS